MKLLSGSVLVLSGPYRLAPERITQSILGSYYRTQRCEERPIPRVVLPTKHVKRVSALVLAGSPRSPNLRSIGFLRWIILSRTEGQLGRASICPCEDFSSNSTGGGGGRPFTAIGRWGREISVTDFL